MVQRSTGQGLCRILHLFCKRADTRDDGSQPYSLEGQSTTVPYNLPKAYFLNLNYICIKQHNLLLCLPLDIGNL